MDQQAIIPLLEQYARGAISPENEAIVTAWLQQVPPDEFDRVLQQCDVPASLRALRPMPAAFAGELESRLDALDALAGKGRRGVIALGRWAAAAAVLLLLGAGAFYWLKRPASRPLAQQQPRRDSAAYAPGGNKALLTLGDGSTIVLDSAREGELTRQGNTSIVKTGGGQLAYRAAGGNEAVVYNTITTPAGGQYQVVLPDGSKVWLNAASSLRFPNRFEGGERRVVLTGEGYFEIAHNKARPFRVSVNNAVVEVLGTHFNVNAYTDENEMRTTLLEGAVRLTRNAATVQLAPGQQARLGRNNEIALVKNADTEQAIAWKNGYFQFDKADLPSLMRQIARWYNLEVVYEGPVKDYEFVGKVARNVYLADVLKALESTSGVHFRLEGKRLVVRS